MTLHGSTVGMNRTASCRFWLAARAEYIVKCPSRPFTRMVSTSGTVWRPVYDTIRGIIHFSFTLKLK